MPHFRRNREIPHRLFLCRLLHFNSGGYRLRLNHTCMDGGVGAPTIAHPRAIAHVFLPPQSMGVIPLISWIHFQCLPGGMKFQAACGLGCVEVIGFQYGRYDDCHCLPLPPHISLQHLRVRREKGNISIQQDDTATNETEVAAHPQTPHDTPHKNDISSRLSSHNKTEKKRPTKSHHSSSIGGCPQTKGQAVGQAAPLPRESRH